jgi:hypothetical protein
MTSCACRTEEGSWQTTAFGERRERVQEETRRNSRSRLNRGHVKNAYSRTSAGWWVLLHSASAWLQIRYETFAFSLFPPNYMSCVSTSVVQQPKWDSIIFHMEASASNVRAYPRVPDLRLPLSSLSCWVDVEHEVLSRTCSIYA